MRADSVEALWDGSKKKWFVRIQVGEEVVRRPCNAPQNAEEAKLRSAVQETLKDEGFEPDVAQLTIKR